MLGLGYLPIATFDEIHARRARTGSDLPTSTNTRTGTISHQEAHRTAGQDAPGNGTRGHTSHRSPNPTPDPTVQSTRSPRSSRSPRQAAALVDVDYNEGPTQQASPMVKYLSKEWVAEGRRLAERDDRLIDATRGMRASILCVVDDAPDHADEVFYIEFDDGRLGDLLSGSRRDHEARIGSATIQIEGDYGTFRRVQEGQLSQKTAVMRGLLRFRGSKLTALRHMRALEELTRVLRRVPTEF